MEELENLMTGQEAEKAPDGGQEGVVGASAQEDGKDGAAESEGEGAEKQESGVAGRNQTRSQTHEDNAAAKAARIKAEQETSERLRKQFDEDIAGLGVPNPFTGRPFKNFQEFKEYGMKFRAQQLEKKAREQGRPVEELREEDENRSYIARKRQEEKTQKEAMEAREKQKQFLAADVRAFAGKYPDIDVAKLEGNQKFRKFCGNRIYKEPLAELYADFVELMSHAERAAVEKAAGKQSRGTGGGGGGGNAVLSPEQQRALDEWNREYPTLKMTAKEFLSR